MLEVESGFSSIRHCGLPTKRIEPCAFRPHRPSWSATSSRHARSPTTSIDQQVLNLLVFSSARPSHALPTPLYCNAFTVRGIMQYNATTGSVGPHNGRSTPRGTHMELIVPIRLLQVAELWPEHPCCVQWGPGTPATRRRSVVDSRPSLCALQYTVDSDLSCSAPDQHLSLPTVALMTAQRQFLAAAIRSSSLPSSR